MGLGGLVVLLLLSVVFKKDFLSLLDGGAVATETAPVGPLETTPDEEFLKSFIEAVLIHAQATWDSLLVQTLLGIEAQVRSLANRDPGQAKGLSVRMELQAD